MRIRPRTQDTEPEVNLTPLIDVVFLLLIFFMVTTSFIQDSELHIELPYASVAPQPEQTSGIRIAVNAEGRYFLNGQELINTEPETLKQALRKITGEEANGPLVIRADAQASHQAVVTVLDVAGQLGYANIVIETANREEGG